MMTVRNEALGLRALLLWNLRSFFSRFGKSDGDRLLAAPDLPAFSAFARTQRAFLLAAHSAFYRFTGGFAVLAAS